MKVKICGITSVEDALLVESLGADFIGLIFTKISKRQIMIDKAKEIASALTTAKPVGLFVEQSLQEAVEIAEQVSLQAIQVHQSVNEKIEGLITIEVVLLGDEKYSDRIEESQADFILIDAVKNGEFGGKGLKFDWSLLPESRKRVFLAGGINPGNVVDAVKQKCYAIDLCSGVESAPGVKNPERLSELFNKLKDY